MADIILRMMKICSGSTLKYQNTCIPNPPTGCISTGTGIVLTYHMRNFSCQSIDLDTPVTIIRLPQEGAECTITIKVEGNQQTISVGWTLMDETLSGITSLVDQFDGMCGRPATVLTVCDQIDFLFNTFENKTINHEWDLFLGCTGLSTSTTLSQSAAATDFTNSSLFKRHIKILQITATKTGRTPITYNAIMRFVVGSPEITVSEEST